MKELHGTAAEFVAAPLDQCFALLADIDGYPSWYPDAVRGVEVLDHDGDGRPSRVRAKLHLSQGPLVKDFDLVLAVELEPHRMVKLTKATESSREQFGVIWQLREGESTRIELHLHASLSVPRFLPVGGIGDSIARGFLAAATSALGRPTA